MSEELSNWIYTFLHVFYFKWATDPSELREFYRESSSLTRKMDSKATQPVHEEQATGVEQCMMRMKECGKLNGEVKILLVDYQNIHIESEGLMISVFGVITPKNVMDGSISRHFSHNFLLLRKTSVWHIQNDIFRIIPPMPLFGIAGVSAESYPLFVRGNQASNAGANTNHYTGAEEAEENAQPSPPPPGNFRPMETQQQMASNHPPPSALSAQHFGPTSPPNLPPPTNPPNQQQHFEPGPQAPIPNWHHGVTDSSAMYPPERFSAAPLVPNTGGPPGHLDVPAGLSRDPLPEQPPTNLPEFEPGPQLTSTGAGMPPPDQSKHQMPPAEEQPARVAPTASGPPPMGGPTDLEPAQPPQEPQQAQEQITAEAPETGPKKPSSWANIAGNKMHSSGPKEAKPQFSSPQPIMRQPEPVSSVQRGGRRKPRGGGRGGGASPANKRKPFRGGDLKSKPAIFFQAKETDTKAFNELGITDKVLGDQFQKYGSLAKVDVRAKYGFIYFETEEGRNKAMDQKEVEINGLTIRVERKRPQPRSYGGQNRGGGRGSGLRGARGGRGGRRRT